MGKDKIVYGGLALALLILVWILSTKKKEMFVPEFLDQSNVMKTAKTRQSSYAQETNHFVPMENPQDPIPGTETPFRVNMFNSHMV